MIKLTVNIRKCLFFHQGNSETEYRCTVRTFLLFQFPKSSGLIAIHEKNSPQIIFHFESSLSSMLFACKQVVLEKQF